MILAGTGHRPNKLGGYDAHTYARLVALATAAIKRFTPIKIISGMALGWDQALAEAAYNCAVPFIAAVPFKGQESMWPAQSQQLYTALLGRATEVVVVSPGSYSAHKMQVRNEWMVNNATHVLALWDGTSGGTRNCVMYARSIDRPIINLWSSWVAHKDAT